MAWVFIVYDHGQITWRQSPAKKIIMCKVLKSITLRVPINIDLVLLLLPLFIF